MKEYTVILLYPDGAETFIESVQAETPRIALGLVEEKAVVANDFNYAPDDFQFIAVFEGDLTPVL